MISKPGLLKLAKKHPETLPTLTLWYRAAEKANWRGLHEIRQDYASVDQVGEVLIFNVLGNSYRLIASVNYRRKQVFVRALLTHSEYERKGWMKWA